MSSLCLIENLIGDDGTVPLAPSTVTKGKRY